MTVEAAFVGGAGTGKTHRLIDVVSVAAAARVWQPYESVLALTLMHGSRRRLHQRLGRLARTGVLVDVQTIDAFCLRIVNRFRRRLDKDLPVIPSDGADAIEWNRDARAWRAPFPKIQEAAVELLRSDVVRQCVAVSHPLVVVDEFQDCEPLLVQVVDGLARASRTFIAADPFQHLVPGVSACPAHDWLTSNANITTLGTAHRTNQTALLNSATCLRDGVAQASCVDVVGMDGPGLAAFKIASLLAWSNWRQGTTALITPSRTKFVDDVLKSLSKQLGKKKKIGPYPFTWIEDTTAATSLDDMLKKNSDGITLTQLHDARQNGENPHMRMVCAAAHRRVRLRGDLGIAVSELRSLSKVMSTASSGRVARRLAMTVHGAKNQEFERVVVVWPYGIKADKLFQRKLLYNALTRATQDAIVLVQGGQNRVSKDAILQLLRG